MSVFESYIFENNSPNLAQTINTANIGLWEFDVYTQKVLWSLGFYKVLGYQPGEIECSYSNFIDNILYYQDKNNFLNTINNKNTSFPVVAHIRLLTNKGFEWFESTTQKQDDAKITGTIVNINKFKILEFQAAADKFYVNKLIKLGGWEIDVATNNVTLSNEALDIFELQHNEIKINELTEFFLPKYLPIVRSAIDVCCKSGRPFDIDAKLKTAKNNIIWVKTKAVASIDNYGKCIAIKGIVQDITVNKQNESELKTSLNSVSHQNQRLQNFAYIVSHNLRSYVVNLQFMINLHEETEPGLNRQEIFSHIKTISNSLNTTIEHLNGIVKIESEKNNDKTLIEFDLLFKNIVNAYQSTIQSTEAVINYNFSKCPSVLYLPAYLESIFHNLLGNALKYRSPDRAPVINCESKLEDGHVYITFEDNGLGIDLKLYGHKVFGMHQTFHQNADSQGIGLFITKNQIEALGGTITVESEVNVGTKFIIRLI